jgi:hypothetical protein
MVTRSRSLSAARMTDADRVATDGGEPTTRFPGDQRRARRILAASPNEAIEAIMLAPRDALATAERLAMKAGRQSNKVIWLAIAESGRQALGG